MIEIALRNSIAFLNATGQKAHSVKEIDQQFPNGLSSSTITTKIFRKFGVGTVVARTCPTSNRVLPLTGAAAGLLWRMLVLPRHARRLRRLGREFPALLTGRTGLCLSKDLRDFTTGTCQLQVNWGRACGRPSTDFVRAVEVYLNLRWTAYREDCAEKQTVRTTASVWMPSPVSSFDELPSPSTPSLQCRRGCQ
jgi:hypothetical protein